ncbi:MAG TPA: hypothetical protein GXX29_01790 [Firmicutes bacterium]|nr:hypothetical protein [Bacillota bacterium]
MGDEYRRPPAPGGDELVDWVEEALRHLPKEKAPVDLHSRVMQAISQFNAPPATNLLLRMPLTALYKICALSLALISLLGCAGFYFYSRRLGIAPLVWIWERGGKALMEYAAEKTAYWQEAGSLILWRWTQTGLDLWQRSAFHITNWWHWWRENLVWVGAMTVSGLLATALLLCLLDRLAMRRNESNA